MRISWVGNEVSDSKHSHVGPKLAIPNPKFCHAIPVALDIAVPGPVLIIPRLFIFEIWMGKLMVIHLLGALPPAQVLIMTMMMWHLGLPSILIMAQGMLIERDS